MKSLFFSVVMTVLFASVLSCASWRIRSPVPLNLRQLRISQDEPGQLEYSYECCKKTLLGVCVSKELCTDTYDLTDYDIREKLIDMDFVCKVREKP